MTYEHAYCCMLMTSCWWPNLLPLFSDFLSICEAGLDWLLDKRINPKKSSCIRFGARFGVECSNISTYKLLWSDNFRYLCTFRQLIHSELHWLDIPERVNYKLGVITRRCLYVSALQYLAACCVPVSTTASR